MADQPRRSLRLRTRVTLYFSLTALAAGVGLAGVTFAAARGYLLNQRTSTAQSRAFASASTVRERLRSGSSDVNDLVRALKTETNGSAVLVKSTGEIIPSDTRFSLSGFPDDLKQLVADGGTGQQRFTRGGQPYIAVGIAIAAFDSQYFEAFPMEDTDRTLRAIMTALIVGTVVTTLLAAGLGSWTSRRLLHPLSRVAQTAGEIASGGLDARMAPETDPDLARLADSFNGMADAVQTRIEREARFASDVSHELRSPITALSAAVEVLDGRRNDLPERSQQALDVVVSQVRRFDQMVMDLLELSRIDAGSTDLHREDVNLAELVPRIAQRYGFAETPIVISPRIRPPVRLDKLRFERILANLLDNAGQHGGGPIRVGVDPHGNRGIVLSVDDAGPGVARGERSRIFERFARGSAARHRVGTGLGLALVAEHAHAHGGEAWVEDRQGGGARFLASFENAR